MVPARGSVESVFLRFSVLYRTTGTASRQTEFGPKPWRLGEKKNTDSGDFVHLNSVQWTYRVMYAVIVIVGSMYNYRKPGVFFSPVNANSNRKQN